MASPTLPPSHPPTLTPFDQSPPAPSHPTRSPSLKQLLLSRPSVYFPTIWPAFHHDKPATAMKVSSRVCAWLVSMGNLTMAILNIGWFAYGGVVVSAVLGAMFMLGGLWVVEGSLAVV